MAARCILLAGRWASMVPGADHRAPSLPCLHHAHSTLHFNRRMLPLLKLSPLAQHPAVGLQDGGCSELVQVELAAEVCPRLRLQFDARQLALGLLAHLVWIAEPRCTSWHGLLRLEVWQALCNMIIRVVHCRQTCDWRQHRTIAPSRWLPREPIGEF